MTNLTRRSEARGRGFQRIRQMTFGELVEALEMCDPDAAVKFTFGLHPLLEAGKPPFTYYHGYHDNVAISFTGEGRPPTVQQMLDAIRPWRNQMIEAEFGELFIDMDMPLWAGHEPNDTALVGIEEDAEWNVVLLQTWAMT